MEHLPRDTCYIDSKKFRLKLNSRKFNWLELTIVYRFHKYTSLSENFM